MAGFLLSNKLLSCCLLATALLWSCCCWSCCLLATTLWSCLLSCCLLATLWSCLLSCCLLATLWSCLLCCCLLATLLWCCFLSCGHVLLLSEWFGSVTQTCSWISVTSIGQKCQHFVTNNLARVANLYFYFFMHLRKFHQFLFLLFINFVKICKNPSKLCQVRKSRPLIEGLGVIFLPFSDFRGHICRFGCRIF